MDLRKVIGRYGPRESERERVLKELNRKLDLVEARLEQTDEEEQEVARMLDEGCPNG